MGTHIINRQVIDLKVNSQKNAFGIQQRVREIYFEEVVPLLGKVMDEMTTGDEVLYLDRLEIDLGVLNFDNLSKELIGVLRHKITDQLKDQFRENKSAAEATFAAQKSTSVLKTAKESKLELIRIFFLTGNLPWWADDENNPPDIDALTRELLKKEPTGLFAVLREVVSQKAGAQRVFFQVAEKVKQEIVAALPANTLVRVRDVLSGLTQVMESRKLFSMTQGETSRLVFMTAIAVHAEMNNVSASDADDIIVRALVKEITHILSVSNDYVEQKMYRDVLIFLIRQPAPENFLLPVVRHFEKWESEQAQSAIQVTGDVRLSIAALTGRSDSPVVQEILDEAIMQFSGRQASPAALGNAKRKTGNAAKANKPESIAQKKSDPESEYDAGDELPLMSLPEEIRALIEPPGNSQEGDEPAALALTRYAGLVLVAPFLPAFFEEMQLLENGNFRGDTERYKAIHFLNFLATNKTKAPEYSLALHKLLCAMEITDPVPKGVKLSASEKKAAILFLDDIAEQWTALRGTSGEAFRETFLKRNGIIDQRENAFLLRIERAPMDVLLDTLPWNISIIKLPWMQQLLHVEW